MTQTAQSAEEKEVRYVWGLRNIGLVIDRTEEQAAYLAKVGAFGDAVKKVAGQYVGHVRRLQNLDF